MTPCSCEGNLILVAVTIVSSTAPQITLIRRYAAKEKQVAEMADSD